MKAGSNIAVIGSGISGLTVAHTLDAEHRVTLFEADHRLGGHTDTHAIVAGNGHYSVDSGFIVFNKPNYPNFSRWLDQLGVGSKPSDMSFSVRSRSAEREFEYGTRDLGALFAQRANLASPGFWKFLLDLRDFYQTGAAAAQLSPDVTVKDYVAQKNYGEVFVHQHLVPMCSALWSQPSDKTLDIPICFVVAFMQHHLMLQVQDRPQWRVVEGGSSTYLRAFEKQFGGSIRLKTPVHGVQRQGGGARLFTPGGSEDFDAVFLACHSDQALSILQDPSAQEAEILGAFDYQQNRVVVHSDPSVMPRRRQAWSSWNALTGQNGDQCQVTYWMNRLQGFAGNNFFVTLNPAQRLENEYVQRQYAHPVITAASVNAQQRKSEVDGLNNTYFCGAYWGWGFHEDGVNSALSALDAFNMRLANAA